MSGSLCLCLLTQTEQKRLSGCLWNSLRLRVFRRKEGYHYAFDYHSDKKLWMETTPFYGLPRCSDVSCNKCACKMFLLLGSCNVHGLQKTFPDLKNVDFLIASVNARFWAYEIWNGKGLRPYGEENSCWCLNVSRTKRNEGLKACLGRNGSTCYFEFFKSHRTDM